MTKLLPILLFCVGVSAAPLLGQSDTLRRDTVTVQGSIYNRPFIASVGRTAIGGYVEGNSYYAKEDGVGDGLSLQLRRFNIFLFSAIGSRMRFTSELEFEDGAREISLETALLDFDVLPGMTLRAGILLPAIGAFNAGHDSPRWDVIDRPLVSTEIIPATLSEVGVGIHGRLFPFGITATYDAYLTNGLGEGVILNDRGRTHLASGKGEERFEEDENGSPALSGRIAAKHPRFGELGLSWYGGIYNRYQVEGEVVDKARRLSITALDIRTKIGSVELRGELASARIDVPDDLGELFGERQLGWHLDATQPLFRPKLRGLPDAILSAVVRLEQVDYNRGRFASTGGPIGDEVRAAVVGLSFRPVDGTVFRANYRRQWAVDLPRNAPVRSGALQLGFATYF